MAKLKNVKEELFCKFYAGKLDMKVFGSQTESYMMAYENDNYQSSAVSATKLLKKAKIVKRCQEILNDLLSNKNVDSELAYVIQQRKDLSSKMRGIQEYNKLKQRITEKKEVIHLGLAGLLEDITKDNNNPVNE